MATCQMPTTQGLEWVQWTQWQGKVVGHRMEACLQVGCPPIKWGHVLMAPIWVQPWAPTWVQTCHLTWATYHLRWAQECAHLQAWTENPRILQPCSTLPPTPCTTGWLFFFSLRHSINTTNKKWDEEDSTSLFFYAGCLVTLTWVQGWWDLDHLMALPWTACLEWWTLRVDHLILWGPTWPITPVVSRTEKTALSLVLLLFLSNIYQCPSLCLGMAPSPEMNNKMNNKVDGSGTPKPEPKSKVRSVSWTNST